MEKKKLQDLLTKMTLSEKIAQLQQLTGDFFIESESEITGPVVESGLSIETVLSSGSVLGISGGSKIKEIQEKYLAESRLKIPLLFMADVVHGYRTVFPIPLGMASSWNPNLVEEAAKVAAKESALAGLHVTFSPMVDLVRDPRWGRVMESTGEDPYLNQIYAKAFVYGYQGNPDELDKNEERVAACVKHFAAYGAPEGGREYNTVNMSDRQLRENYLPSYIAALEAGCKLVMTAFNTVDGMPATGNRYLMREILRGELDFKGVLISDWAAVMELINHGVAADEKEAAYLGITAGVDIEMMTFCYQHFLKELVESGEVSELLVDEAVLRILELKNDLGLFENPFRGVNEVTEKNWTYSEEPLTVAQKVAEESIVLLKNNREVLPLKETEKVLVVGPFTDNSDLLGNWACCGNKNETPTLKDVWSKIAKQIDFVPVSDLWELTDAEKSEIQSKVEKVDKIILTLGESADMSGEAASRTNIQLPEAQLELLELVIKYNIPTIAVLINGRPLDISELSEKVDGLVEAWFPGSRGAQAIVRILYGKVNPSAKLTMSFPRNVGQIPVYYNHYRTGRPAMGDNDLEEKYVSKYIDVSNTPLYPFGYGLSYSQFDYAELQMEKTIYQETETIKASVKVKNNSERDGYEIVQWYVWDQVGEVVRPVKELKRFDKLFLRAGETQTVAIELPISECAYYHQNGEKKVDPGKFELMVGTNSEDVLKKEFEIKM